MSCWWMLLTSTTLIATVSHGGEFAGPFTATGYHPGRLIGDHRVTALATADSQDRQWGGSGTNPALAATTDANISGLGGLAPYGGLKVSPAAVFRSKKDESGFYAKPSAFHWGVDYHQDIYGSEKNTVLFEVGTHSGSFDALLDLGLAYRRGLGVGQGGHIVGGNLFVDHNQTGERTGGSVGIEWMVPGLASLHANFYRFFQDGKKDETRAKTDSGFDVSLKTALTVVPALAVETRYSYWFAGKFRTAKQAGEKTGRKLDVADGTALALSWQPIPLVKLSASHAFLSTKNNKTQLLMELHIGLGQPFHSQLQLLSREITKGAVAKSMRARFVNRDPVLVAEYPLGIGGPEVVFSSWAANPFHQEQESGLPEQALVKGMPAVVVTHARYANGQPAPGVGVTWKVTPEESNDGVQIIKKAEKTDQRGRAVIVLTNRKAENVQVEASFAGQ